MPNHIHLIEKSGDIDLLEKLRVLEKKQVFKVWQDRFDDVYLANKKLLETKLDYIHTNHLQEHWNLVSKPEDWLHSSAMFYELCRQPIVTVTDYREFFSIRLCVRSKDLTALQNHKNSPQVVVGRLTIVVNLRIIDGVFQSELFSMPVVHKQCFELMVRRCW